MKSHDRKFYSTVGLALAACLILLFFAYMTLLEPQRQKKKSVASRLVEQKRAFQNAQNAATKETQDRLKSQVADLKNTLSKFVVDVGESTNLTFDISGAAARRRLRAFSIKSKQSRTVPGKPEFSYITDSCFDVTFNAGFGQFATFLSTLERHEPTLFVDKFVITRSDKPGEGHPVKLDFAVLVEKRQGD